jgi:DNA-directed RNA polymerase specialized sigma24 family protein
METEDIYQELLYRLYKSVFLWDSAKGTFMTYLYYGLQYQIAWLKRKQYKSDKRKANINTDSIESLSEEGQDIPEAWNPSSSEELFNKSELCTIKMTVEEKTCVLMLIQGHRKIDIARTLGVSISKVNQIFRDLGPRFKRLLQ